MVAPLSLQLAWRVWLFPGLVPEADVEVKAAAPWVPSRQRHLRFARKQPKFQTRSLQTSGGQTTKFPAYCALVK